MSELRRGDWQALRADIDADAVRTVRGCLGRIVNIADELIQFGRIWAIPDPHYAPHDALCND